jgi:hypothetical protein
MMDRRGFIALNSVGVIGLLVHGREWKPRQVAIVQEPVTGIEKARWWARWILASEEEIKTRYRFSVKTQMPGGPAILEVPGIRDVSEEHDGCYYKKSAICYPVNVTRTFCCEGVYAVDPLGLLRYCQFIRGSIHVCNGDTLCITFDSSMEC